MSEDSYTALAGERAGRRGCPKTKSPVFEAGLYELCLPVVDGISAAAYFGAEESAPVAALLFFDLWLCFLWLFAGAEAEVSEEGAAVSAANTGPAANSVSRLTTGTSFLNIDRLQWVREN